MAYSINYTPSKMVNWGNMSLKPPDQLVWDQIFRKDGRVLLEPFPRFDELVEAIQLHGCTKILDLGCGSGQIVHAIQAHSKRNYALAFSLDGQQLIVDTLSGSIYAYQVTQ